MIGRYRAALLLAGVVALLASAGAAQQTGAFALLGGKAAIVSKFWAAHSSGETYALNVQQFTTSGATIKAYDIDMQHLMHMVIVRDDFATFAHEHPSFNATTGIFVQNFTKEPNHKYYAFADTSPKGIGQQVFRFTLESDGEAAAYKLSTVPSSYNQKAGPYNVLLQKTTIRAQTPQKLDLTVVEGDDPATDLVPYLGAAAHVVMIDISTLSYVHVHRTLKGQTMSMKPNSMRATMVAAQKAGPFMDVTLPALPAGVYKTWVQVAGGPAKTVYTAAFTIVAK
ncbi:MAG: hypothetical protein JO175_11335 [Candidatus Eremiobacteraeota bacterium]|nr:hypothetical protein [Candidatus Eremiobacteraeota bacterium]